MIYAIRNPRTRSVKIGYSREPDVRVKGLQTANEDELVLEGWAHGDIKVEERFHVYLADENIRGEWFRGPKTESIVILLTLMKGSVDKEEEKVRRSAILHMLDSSPERLNMFSDYIKNWDDSKAKEQVSADIERILGWGSPFCSTDKTINALRCDRCKREFDMDLIVEKHGDCGVECGCGKVLYTSQKEGTV